MYIYQLDLFTGKRDLVWFHKGEITLGIDGNELRQHRRKYPLHLRFDDRNLTVIDHGLPDQVTIADALLELDRPRIWLPHQELRIGERYLLSWSISREQPSPSTKRGIDYRSAWRLGRQPGGLFSTLLFNLRRGFGLNLERIVPLILIFCFIIIFVFIALTLRNYYGDLTAEITKVPPLTLMPTMTPPPARTPIPTPYVLFPNTPFPPTVVRVENLDDVPPTATEIGALPPGVTPTSIPCEEQTLGRGEWDPALDALNVTFKPACVRPGEQFWHLVEAKWLDVEMSNGAHYVFVDLLDENRQRVMEPPTRFVMQWTTGQCERYMQWESDNGYGGHCPMYAAGAAYRVFVDGLPSDVIESVGLGSIDQREWRILTSYQFKFQRTTYKPE